MKAKLPFLNAFMGLMILFVISFQSVHSFEHLEKQLHEKECRHLYNHQKTEVNHSHFDFEKCFTCEFAFQNSAFLFYKKYHFTVKAFTVVTKQSYRFVPKSFFIGKNFQLRAPPFFMA